MTKYKITFFLEINLIPIPKFQRIERKGEAVDKIKWIEVDSLENLKIDRYFENLVKKEVYHAQPQIHPDCSKKLDTPLDSFHSFMKIILRSIIPNTNEYLRQRGQKRTCYSEIVEFIMCACAFVITSGDFEHFKESVANMRQSLKTDYGIEPLWAGCKLQPVTDYNI